MDHFLFDLDGTLLPMKQEEFCKILSASSGGAISGPGLFSGAADRRGVEGL